MLDENLPTIMQTNVFYYHIVTLFSKVSGPGPLKGVEAVTNVTTNKTELKEIRPTADANVFKMIKGHD